MKSLTLVFLLFVTSLYAQNIDYNLSKGYIADGYDVVAYFNNEALKGDKNYSTDYDGAKYKFVSKENLALFKKNPKKYVPQYGGYCAYAIAQKGKKVGIDPETFLIKDDKLYLFYNSWGTNTLKLWNENGPEALRTEADKQWENVKISK